MQDHFIITAGSTYLDIDAYACCVAMKDLLALQGKNAVAWSQAPCNYSVHSFLRQPGQMTDSLPQGWEDAGYIIVDVSDPEYIREGVPLDKVVAVYDHHTGFEDYWRSRIGPGAQIEFIGAAATLIWRQWKKDGLENRISPATARLLVAAILDNTLDLTSANTTPEDVEAFRDLCLKGNIDRQWCDGYFARVQESVEADLQNALLGDMKKVRDNGVLPSHVAQLCLWDAGSVLQKLPRIRQWFSGMDSWMINLIDIKHRCSYFICDDEARREKIGQIFQVEFQSGVAKLPNPWLRKEIIKKIRDS